MVTIQVCVDAACNVVCVRLLRFGTCRSQGVRLPCPCSTVTRGGAWAAFFRAGELSVADYDMVKLVRITTSFSMVTDDQ